MKTVAFIFGRLNCPSVGHRQLIKTLSAQEADAHYVYLSHTQDAKKNPLNYEDKLRFADELFSEEFPNIDIIDSPARTMIEVLQELKEFDNVILVAGGDRVDSFHEMLNKYNGSPDKAGNILYSFASIDVVSAGDRDPDSEDEVAGMSASKLRAFAVAGDFESFAKGVPTDDKRLAKEIYDAVRKGLKLTERRRLIVETSAENKKLGDLLTKMGFKKGAQEQDTAIKAFYAAQKKDDKLTPEKFLATTTLGKDGKPNGTVESTPNEAPEQEQKKVIEEELKALDYFRQRLASLPANAAVPKMTTAKLFLMRSDPPTTAHAAAIAKFFAVNAATSVLGIIATDIDQKIKDDVRIRTLWTRDLAVAKGGSISILYGTVKEIAAISASKFAKVEYTAQADLLIKIRGIFQTTWNAAKGVAAPGSMIERQLPTLAKGAVDAGIDSPNLAQAALDKTGSELKAKIAQLKKDKTSKPKEAAKAELQAAFISQLAAVGNAGSDEVYKKQVFMAYSAMMRAKKGKGLLDGIAAMLSNEIGAAKKAGEVLGITQIAGAAKQGLEKARDVKTGAEKSTPMKAKDTLQGALLGKKPDPAQEE